MYNAMFVRVMIIVVCSSGAVKAFGAAATC